LERCASATLSSPPGAARNRHRRCRLQSHRRAVNKQPTPPLARQSIFRLIAQLSQSRRIPRGCLGSDVRAAAVLIGSVFVLAACSQAIDYTYSRKNFSSSTFEADLSACKRQGPSISAFQTPPQEKRTQLDDAAVRDCMMAKGYKIGTEGQ